MLYKKFILIATLCVTGLLRADIQEIETIDAIRPYVAERCLILFDIDDTLIDNPFSLGSPPWRNWVKSKLPKNDAFNLYDALTLHIAQKAPYKAVEATTPEFIADLQKQGLAVIGFTARGRSEWYTTTIEGVDRFTHEQLKGAGIDLSQTQVPEELQSLDPAHFYQGIIFAKHIAKGDLLKLLFQDLDYTPSLILFVDDKREQVESVEAALKDSDIPFVGFWYRRSAIDRADFNPLVANIQLEALLLNGHVISDKKAKKLAQSKKDVNPETYLSDILQAIDLQEIAPLIDIN